MIATQRVRAVSVEKLLREVEAGHYAVPKLQRAFVWNGEKAAMLLDSILRGLPVGVVTVWNARRRNSHQLPNTLHILPQPSDALETVKFILDGQQRLSVLYHLARGGVQHNARRQAVDFGRVVLRLKPEVGERLVEYRKPAAGAFFPVHELLRAGWRSRIHGLKARDREYAQSVRRQILAYKVALTIFEGQDLEEARELFIRINSSGTPLASADRAFARAQRIDLRAKTTALRDQLGAYFAGITNETILQVLAFASEIWDIGARAQDQAVRKWEKRAEAIGGSKEFDRVWRRVESGVKNAVDYLQAEFGVRTDAILPSQYMLVTLAQLFAERSTMPSQARREVRAWFWATALGQRYSGRGFRPNVVRDAQVFQKLGLGRAAKFGKFERIPASDIKRALYGVRSSITDAFILMLAHREPQDLLDGRGILLEHQLSASSKTHRHHFFPRSFLARKRVHPRDVNSILNLCLVRANTNASVGGQSPWRYLEPTVEKRWYRKMLRRSLLPDIFSGQYDEFQPENSYRMFLVERLELVTAAFEARAGRPLFISAL